MAINAQGTGVTSGIQQGVYDATLLASQSSNFLSRNILGYTVDKARDNMFIFDVLTLGGEENMEELGYPSKASTFWLSSNYSLKQKISLTSATGSWSQINPNLTTWQSPYTTLPTANTNNIFWTLVTTPATAGIATVNQTLSGSGGNTILLSQFLIVSITAGNGTTTGDTLYVVAMQDKGATESVLTTNLAGSFAAGNTDISLNQVVSDEYGSVTTSNTNKVIFTQYYISHCVSYKEITLQAQLTPLTVPAYGASNDYNFQNSYKMKVTNHLNMMGKKWATSTSDKNYAWNSTNSKMLNIENNDVFKRAFNASDSGVKLAIIPMVFRDLATEHYFKRCDKFLYETSIGQNYSDSGNRIWTSAKTNTNLGAFSFNNKLGKIQSASGILEQIYKLGGSVFTLASFTAGFTQADINVVIAAFQNANAIGDIYGYFSHATALQFSQLAQQSNTLINQSLRSNRTDIGTPYEWNQNLEAYTVGGYKFWVKFVQSLNNSKYNKTGGTNPFNMTNAVIFTEPPQSQKDTEGRTIKLINVLYQPYPVNMQDGGTSNISNNPMVFEGNIGALATPNNAFLGLFSGKLIYENAGVGINNPNTMVIMICNNN